MKILAKLSAIALIGAVLTISAYAQHRDDAGAVRQLLMQTFNKADAPLTVEPVTVEADIAVAGWAQGDMGGRALLKKGDGKWILTLCGGDALKDAAALQHFGLTSKQAQRLSSSVIAAEGKLDPKIVERFSRFDGVVMMNADGEHPPDLTDATIANTQRIEARIADLAEQSLRLNDFDPIVGTAADIFRQHGIAVDQATKEFRLLCSYLLRAYKELARLRHGRLGGNHVLEPQDPLFQDLIKPLTSINATLAT
jgi:hypothetical protein